MSYVTGAVSKHYSNLFLSHSLYSDVMDIPTANIYSTDIVFVQQAIGRLLVPGCTHTPRLVISRSLVEFPTWTLKSVLGKGSLLH